MKSERWYKKDVTLTRNARKNFAVTQDSVVTMSMWQDGQLLAIQHGRHPRVLLLCRRQENCYDGVENHLMPYPCFSADILH